MDKEDLPLTDGQFEQLKALGLETPAIRKAIKEVDVSAPNAIEEIANAAFAFGSATFNTPPAPEVDDDAPIALRRAKRKCTVKSRERAARLVLEHLDKRHWKSRRTIL